MSMVFFFHGTATTELYTTETLFPYTPLFRSQPSGFLVVAAIDGARRNRRRARRRVVLIDTLGLLDQRADFQIGDRLHADGTADDVDCGGRSEVHMSELQSLMRISYAVFCLHKNTYTPRYPHPIFTNNEQ